MIAIQQFSEIRNRLADVVDSVPEESLYEVPKGFKNHIAWNVGHLVVTQQLLHYKLTGQDMHVPAEQIERYRKGTGPAGVTASSHAQVMAFVQKAPTILASDYEAGRLQEFTPYVTSAGIALNSIEEAIVFNNFHEGIHLGYILALRKALAL